jgi:ketosteroid isomerase-like protein
VKRPLAAALLSLGMIGGAEADADPALTLADLQAQVTSAERAFARSMAERDLSAFGRHLSDQAMFFAGAGQVLRGKPAVIAGWAAYFQGPQAPFSWDPDQVEVLPDGTLALSSGLVRNPAGEPVARFNSVWRQEAPGVWRVVFDKGSPLPRE